MKKRSRRLALLALLAGGLLTLAGYITGSPDHPFLFLLLGGVAAGALLYLPKEQAAQEKIKRRDLLTEEYADLVTLLHLYLAAGLSLRSSLEKMVRDYETAKEKGGPVLPAMEEMSLCRREMLGGVYEDIAFSRFGRRCGTPEYLRLGGLLEAYVREGSRELTKTLQAEASASMEVRLRALRKKGEKVGSLLLIPTMLFFILTLVLVMVPAMLSLRGSL